MKQLLSTLIFPVILALMVTVSCVNDHEDSKASYVNVKVDADTDSVAISTAVGKTKRNSFTTKATPFYDYIPVRPGEQVWVTVDNNTNHDVRVTFHNYEIETKSTEQRNGSIRYIYSVDF